MLECSRSPGAECKAAQYGGQSLKRAMCFLVPTNRLNHEVLSPAGKSKPLLAPGLKLKIVVNLMTTKRDNNYIVLTN